MLSTMPTNRLDKGAKEIAFHNLSTVYIELKGL
jgi:hypothetical protein